MYLFILVILGLNVTFIGCSQAKDVEGYEAGQIKDITIYFEGGLEEYSIYLKEEDNLDEAMEVYDQLETYESSQCDGLLEKVSYEINMEDGKTIDRTFKDIRVHSDIFESLFNSLEVRTQRKSFLQADAKNDSKPKMSSSRIAGDDRYQTSAKVALEAYDTAKTVIIARGDDKGGFADGLAAGVLSGVLDAPVLLTAPDSLPASIESALVELGAREAVILGGEEAVFAEVKGDLKGKGLQVKRIYGKTRMDTAALIAEEAHNARDGKLGSHVYVVNGHAPADSLIAGPAAFAENAPVLQVTSEGLPGATAEAIQELNIEQLYVIGGPAVVSKEVCDELSRFAPVERLAGDNRFSTSVEVAKERFPAAKDFAVVGGYNYADAIGAAVFGNPVLYVHSDPPLPPAVDAYLDQVLTSDSRVTVFGGLAAVSEAVTDFHRLKFARELEIEIFVNGEELEPEKRGRVAEGELLLPAAFILEEMGAEVQQDQKNKILEGIFGSFRLELHEGANEVTVSGREKRGIYVDYFDDMAYTPARPLIEAVGGFVNWEAQNKRLEIFTPEGLDPAEWQEEEGPPLYVAYPPEESYSIYNSPLFVYGTTRSYARVDVKVNGKLVEKMDSRTGNFLSMVDVPRGEEFDIKVEATDEEGTTTVKRSVFYPEGLQTMPEKPLKLHDTHFIPDRNQVLNPGDTLRIVARGSPGAAAHFRIGEGAYIEMTELAYPNGPPGRGGIYTATYTVSSDDAPVSGLSETMPVTVILEKDGERVNRKLPGRVAFLSDTPYKVVEVKVHSELEYCGWFRKICDSNYHLYTDTHGGTGYSANVASYLAEGTRFETAGVSGGYYRVKLEENETYLLHKEAVRELENKNSLEPSLKGVNLTETGEKVSLKLESLERFPFLVDSDRNQLEIKLYGVEKDEELLIPEMPGGVKKLSLEPLEPMAGEPQNLVLTVELEENFTGFNSSWEGTDLVFDLDKPPKINVENPLEGKTIVVDPGHGGKDTGATGPGDLHEKDVVLEMSLQLRDMLIEEGAKVIMTRTEDRYVDLYARPQEKYLNETDLFISVHANAHPHGARAVDSHGIMTLYNYKHNEKLASIMLDKMAEGMDLPAMHTWERNIAVTRYTQFPCVLVEAGYMKHPEDNWHIFHPQGQKEFAWTMKEGIKEYFLSLAEPDHF